jgi:hypothetical protein
LRIVLRRGRKKNQTNQNPPAPWNSNQNPPALENPTSVDCEERRRKEEERKALRTVSKGENIHSGHFRLTLHQTTRTQLE